MLKKLLLSFTLFSVLVFSGCTKIVKEYVYIEATCPQIKVLKPVPRIDGRIGPDYSVEGEQLTKLLQGASQLRKTETYYIQEITKYNKEFTKPLDK